MTQYEALRDRNLVVPLDLSRCSTSHPMAPSSKVVLPRKTTVLWVAWGDRHAREALANACWFWEIHREWYENLVVEVRLLGDVLLPGTLIEACRTRGVNVVMGLAPPPENPALYDLDRFKHATSIDGSVLYVDTDLYVLRPLRLDLLSDRRFLTFGMGSAMIDRSIARIHKIVDEWLDGPSYLYWKDVGLTKEDYDSGSFWPWLRINLGMFWINDASSTSSFYETFKAHNEALAFTDYFGLGEMIFTAMHARGDIPSHKFDWRNGWNKVWPWIKDHDQQVGVVMEDSRVTCLYPTGRHDAIHILHLALRAHTDSMWRRVHMWVEDDGSIMLHLGTTPKANDPVSFEDL